MKHKFTQYNNACNYNEPSTKHKKVANPYIVLINDVKHDELIKEEVEEYLYIPHRELISNLYQCW